MVLASMHHSHALVAAQAGEGALGWCIHPDLRKAAGDPDTLIAVVVAEAAGKLGDSGFAGRSELALAEVQGSPRMTGDGRFPLMMHSRSSNAAVVEQPRKRRLTGSVYDLVAAQSHSHHSNTVAQILGPTLVVEAGMNVANGTEVEEAASQAAADIAELETDRTAKSGHNHSAACAGQCRRAAGNLDSSLAKRSDETTGLPGTCG